MNHRLTTIDNFFNFSNFDNFFNFVNFSNFVNFFNFVTFYNRPPTVLNVISFLTTKVITASIASIKKQKTALFLKNCLMDSCPVQNNIVPLHIETSYQTKLQKQRR